MDLAVLFWCYRSIAVCEDRLQHLRRENPATKIYVLFGGPVDDSADWRRHLGPLCDDFYVFDGLGTGGEGESQGEGEEFRDGSRWKWRYGDLLLAAWYRDRGRQLEWDTVLVVQWDLLIFGSIDGIFVDLREGELLLPGLRPIDEIEDEWFWTKRTNPHEREQYENFIRLVGEKYGYAGQPTCFPALLMALPREFLRKYSVIAEPETGFLEYRIPIYAQIYGTRVSTAGELRPSWYPYEKRQRLEALRADPNPISPLVIAANVIRPSGSRVFHPYFDLTPAGFSEWTKAFLRPWRRRFSSMLNRR